jgi:hypothetical protein
VNKIVGDGYTIIDRNGAIYIGGACNITVGNSVNILVQGAADIQVDGAATINLNNNADIGIAGDLNMVVGGDYNLQVDGDFTVNGSVFPGIQSGFGGGGIDSISGNINIGKNCSVFLSARNGNITIGQTLSSYGGNLVGNSANCQGTFSVSGIAGGNVDIDAASIIING